MKDFHATCAQGATDSEVVRAKADVRPYARTTPPPRLRCPWHPARRSGFSLLEVILALIVVALIASVLGAALIGTLRLEKSARTQMAPDAQEAAFAAQWREDMLGTPWPSEINAVDPDEPTEILDAPLVLTHTVVNGHRADTLVFRTCGPVPLHPSIATSAPYPGMVEIAWTPVADPDPKRGFAWVRTRQVNLLATTQPPPTPTSEVMLEGLADCQVQALVNQGTVINTFMDDYNSDTYGKMLPPLLRLQYAYLLPDGSSGPTHVMILPFVQASMDPNQGGGIQWKRRAFAYILTLTVILIVAMVALILSRGAAVHLNAGNDTAARAQCEQAALGMIRAVVHDLEIARKAGNMPALSLVHPEGEIIGDCAVMLIGRSPTPGKFSFGLISEAAKIDVNPPGLTSASKNNLIAALNLLPGMTQPVAGAVEDWINMSVSPVSNVDYSGQPVPYQPHNEPVQSLDELRMVFGMTDAMYFGEDANQNGVLDAGEDANGDGLLTPGLQDLLTIDTRSPGATPDGSQLLIVTNISRRQLENIFGVGRGDQIYAAGQGVTFNNCLQYIQTVGLTDIETQAIWPYLKGPEGRVGLIDAYACRPEVLNATVGPGLAQTIIQARPTTPPLSPFWLAQALGPNCATLNRWPGLTSGSYQFTLDVLAVRTDGSSFCRLRARVDLSGDPAAAVVSLIRPAEALGWPLPWVTPEQLRRRAPGTDPLTLLSAVPN